MLVHFKKKNGIRLKRQLLFWLLIGSAFYGTLCAQTKSFPTFYASDEKLTQPEIFVPGIISTGDDEAHVAFGEQGKILYYIKNSPNFNHWTVVVSKFKNESWQTPEVAWFSGRYSDADVSFSPDGETMFFISNRPIKENDPPRTNTDIWKMHKTPMGWSEPQHISILSSPGNEWFPIAASDGTLYFGSERRKDNSGIKGTSDLYRSEWVNGHYTEPVNLGKTINTSGQDIEAYISPDESFMIIVSNGREVNFGSYDLYISYQTSTKWTEPKNLGDKINSSSWDFGPKISPDGKYLFFTSNRSASRQVPRQRLTYQGLLHRIRSPKNGLRDIYQVDISQITLPSPSH